MVLWIRCWCLKASVFSSLEEEVEAQGGEIVEVEPVNEDAEKLLNMVDVAALLRYRIE